MGTLSKGTLPTKPFLRWAGGKRWLVPSLREILCGLKFNNYHEPFLGGGAVFFGLNPSGRAYLSDLNFDLIETYLEVANNPKEVVRAMKRHSNSEQYYYKLRSEKYSNATARAARFIFLNQTSFNGIYRVNLQGEYNVPYGYREGSRVPTEAHILEISERLQGAKLLVQDFTKSAKSIKAGDLVFVESPLHRCSQQQWIREIQPENLLVRRSDSIEGLHRLGPNARRLLRDDQRFAQVPLRSL